MVVVVVVDAAAATAAISIPESSGKLFCWVVSAIG